ncbi:MAG TPA: DUF309 domain-containing protein [Candidatus Thermoplasmatota archaeon]|nr:DUF309 domain-containing protein [Candidatus Thermoplasmatota archaeon]
MAKGPDPRAAPAPRADVPRLLREGAHEFGARRFWHAHEAWESAWHALRAAQESRAAECLHGLILVAAALENATRGKESGFKRQMAEGLHLLRTHLDASPALGLADPGALADALVTLYLDACRRVRWEDWNASGWRAPPVEVSG